MPLEVHHGLRIAKPLARLLEQRVREIRVSIR
jgi:hypothetical protein